MQFREQIVRIIQWGIWIVPPGAKKLFFCSSSVFSIYASKKESSVMDVGILPFCSQSREDLK